jgi:hypothetical protein
MQPAEYLTRQTIARVPGRRISVYALWTPVNCPLPRVVHAEGFRLADASGAVP